MLRHPPPPQLPPFPPVGANEAADDVLMIEGIREAVLPRPIPDPTLRLFVGERLDVASKSALTHLFTSSPLHRPRPT
jgi:hypothetical protein